MIEDAFLGLGYEIVDDREVETVHYNFDQLAFPPAHPTRSPRDIALPRRGAPPPHRDLSLADPHAGGEEAAHLHGPISAYRRDEITATRFPIFHQSEGLAVDRTITLADLKGRRCT